MKKLTLILIIVFCVSMANAQPKSSDQIRSLKIAHISSVLNLTSDEAEKFWPLFNTYDKQLAILRGSSIIKYLKTTESSEIETISEKEATEKIQSLIDFEEDYFTLRKNFIIDCKKILSNKKILLLKKAEEDFNKKLLKQYKSNK